MPKKRQVVPRRCDRPPTPQIWNLPNQFQDIGMFSGGKYRGTIRRQHQRLFYHVNNQQKSYFRKSWKLSMFSNDEAAHAFVVEFATAFSDQYGISRNAIRSIAPEVLEMKLKGGHTTIFDEDQYARIKDFSWISREGRNTAYVHSGPTTGGIPLHRLLTNAGPDDVVDHIDRNGLNNMLSNLRLTTRVGNANNTKLHKTNKSGVSGVSPMTRIRNGKPEAYWVASWSEKGNPHCKQFSIRKYGEDLAMQKAIKLRRAMDMKTGCQNGYKTFS